MTLHAKAREQAAAKAASAPPTVEEARRFVDDAENKLLDLWIKSSRADWVHETYITDDTEQMAADADEAVASATAELAAQSRRFDGLKLPDDVARKIMLLRLSVSIPAPRDPALSAELSKINSSLDSEYGKGKWCPDGPSSDCMDVNKVTNIFATSRDPNELLRAWEGWNAIGKPMRDRYSRMVMLANAGSRELGFARTHGRNVALRLRHAARSIRRRSGPPLAAGSTALPFAARLRALAASEKVWAGSCQ